jgi:hypothetical protein
VTTIEFVTGNGPTLKSFTADFETNDGSTLADAATDPTAESTGWAGSFATKTEANIAITKIIL